METVSASVNILGRTYKLRVAAEDEELTVADEFGRGCRSALNGLNSSQTADDVQLAPIWGGFVGIDACFGNINRHLAAYILERFGGNGRRNYGCYLQLRHLCTESKRIIANGLYRSG